MNSGIAWALGEAMRAALSTAHWWAVGCRAR